MLCYTTNTKRYAILIYKYLCKNGIMYRKYNFFSFEKESQEIEIEKVKHKAEKNRTLNYHHNNLRKNHPNKDHPVDKIFKTNEEQKKEENNLTNEFYNKIMDEYKLNNDEKLDKIKNIKKMKRKESPENVDKNIKGDKNIKNEKVIIHSKHLTNNIIMDESNICTNNVNTESININVSLSTHDIKKNKKIIKKNCNSNIINCTEEKHINNMLIKQTNKNKNDNLLTLNEKKKNDHFYKIFFSSKKVKIIKSQNHPIFIHLYKLASDRNYRQKQEKVILTNKKIILEREKNHISRIYTNSINNLRDFRSYDNFILLSNKLLKKLSFLYSFNNGVIAEITHKFYFDNVGLPFLAFCFYNINYEPTKKKQMCLNHINNNIPTVKTNINMDIANSTNISNINDSFCYNLISEKNLNRSGEKNFNVMEEMASCKKIKEQVEEGQNEGQNGSQNEGQNGSQNGCQNGSQDQSQSKEPNEDKIYTNDKLKNSHTCHNNNNIEYLCNGDIGTLIRSCFLLKWQCIFNIDNLNRKRKNKIKSSYKNMDINNIYDIDFFHPLTIRASSGYLLDIPFKNTDINEIYKYCKENKILMLKYKEDSDLYINYKNLYTEDDNKFLYLLSKAKGVFLIMDNCNNIERTYNLIYNNYINISNNINSENIFDNIYYVNLKNDETKPLDLISTYSIFMYILRSHFFKHIPQSSYVYVE
ncbi:conserved Plasmodium protein, unknown function [Plasmodium reichenowi]|uniref:Uncharacterized protein n=1 Tax=Plasmodium reichenowi TaxID=5854 RepID=A0A060RTQ0_PLARE|nr:conserved Plasmodium protein, unknown function [Plasmodium reichenowi]